MPLCADMIKAPPHEIFDAALRVANVAYAGVEVTQMVLAKALGIVAPMVPLSTIVYGDAYCDDCGGQRRARPRGQEKSDF